MLKKANILTRPTPARQDAPFRGQGRSERPKIVLPCSLVYVTLRMTRMSSLLRASNEGLLRPRVARAQGTHQAILPPAGGLFQHPSRRRS
jgi:hypothetical protein